MPVYSLRYLFEVCSNPVKLINFLLAKGLIKRDRRCSRRNCRRRMIIIRDNSRKEKFIFRCPHCKFSQSIRRGSFFQESHLTVAEILYVTFCWAAKILPRRLCCSCMRRRREVHLTVVQFHLWEMQRQSDTVPELYFLWTGCSGTNRREFSCETQIPRRKKCATAMGFRFVRYYQQTGPHWVSGRS